MGGFRDMLKHLAAEDAIKAGAGRGDGRDIADQIEATGIPGIALQALSSNP